MLKAYFLAVFICFSGYLSAQTDIDNRHQLVLEKGIIDSAYTFDRSKTGKHGKEYDILKLTYLGSVTTRHGTTFKVIVSFHTFGTISPHGVSKLVIFNDKNQFAGSYHVGMPYDLPTKMVNGVLYFNNNVNSDCNKGTRLKLDLKKGLPSQFFLPCNGNMGDFYRFD